MNSVLRNIHPLRHILCLSLGLVAAVAGIWLFSAIDLAVLQGVGFALLAPAGVLMAVGLCRLWDDGCRSGKLALPSIPAPLRREVCLSKSVRNAATSLSKAHQEEQASSEDREERRSVSWAE